MSRLPQTHRDAAIAEAYRSGLSLAAIGALYGLASLSSVARVLERQGVQRRIGGRYADPRSDQQLAELYASGMTAEQVAAHVGLGSGNAVLRALRRLGIERRKRGASKATVGAAKAEKAARNAAIVQAYRSGLSLDAVASAHGISRTRVQEILVAAGEPRRPAPAPHQHRHAPGVRLLAADSTPIIPAGVKHTVWQPRPDPRDAGREPEPFFARGVALPPSPWVQAVIGGRP